MSPTHLRWIKLVCTFLTHFPLNYLSQVYTINQESRYLLVQGVPAINVTDELLKLLSLYGTIDEYRILEDYPAEAFTKVYWIKYTSIQAAR